MKGRDIVINIGDCADNTVEKTKNPDASEELADGENSVKNLPRNAKNMSPESGEKNKNRKEKRTSMSAKKPPRPPRGLSLDAADQKLIKEFSELLMIKRARIERIKALKKAKASPSSTSSSGNFLAMVFTVLFCVVFIFQGCHPWGVWPRNGSPKSNGATEDNVVAFEGQRNLSSSSVHMLSEVGSPNQGGLVPGSDNQAGNGKATH